MRKAAEQSRQQAMGAAAMANVSLRRVSKRFGTVEAVCDLSLTINDGEFVVLLGPSGAGKTTTLRLISGLSVPIMVRFPSTVVTSQAIRRERATLLSSSSNFHFIRTLPFTITSRSRCDRRHVAFPSRSSADASSRRRSCCISPASLGIGRRACPAAKCSGSRSGGLWCGIPPSI